MDYMFGAAAAFNDDISIWDVSRVTGMSYMFNAVMAFNDDISSWDVYHVTILHSHGCMRQFRCSK